MKNALLIPLVFVLALTGHSQVVTDSNWDGRVKSVFLTRSDIELERPYVRMADFGEEGERLMLRFDLLDPQAQMLRYRIRHCNKDWEPDGLEAGEYLSGAAEGEIEGHQSSFNTRREYVNYYQLLPAAYSNFTASGNYVVEVFPSEHADSTLLTRRFCVYEQGVEIEAEVGKPTGAYGYLRSDQEVAVTVRPQRGSFLPIQAEYYHTVVQQNGRLDLRRELPFSGYAADGILYQYKRENVFAGGNHFRYFDLSNLWAAMYHVQRIEQEGGQVYAFLQPEENRSRKVYTQYSSLNGGMKVNIREHSNPQAEADYVWVSFSLPMERPFMDGSVHIVGDLTQWQLNDSTRMDWNSKYRTYTKHLLLKQGYYSYQLLFLPTGEREGLTATLEGDHYEMPNNYTVYVYYSAPGSRYDRLVGLKQVYP